MLENKLCADFSKMNLFSLLTPEDQPSRPPDSLTEKLVQNQQKLSQQHNRTQHQQQLIQHQNLTQHQQSVQHKQHQLKQHQIKSVQLQTSREYEQQGFPKQLIQHQQLPQPHSLTTDQFGSLIKVIKKTQLLKTELMTIFFYYFNFLLKETQKHTCFSLLITFKLPRLVIYQGWGLTCPPAIRPHFSSFSNGPYYSVTHTDLDPDPDPSFLLMLDQGPYFSKVTQTVQLKKTVFLQGMQKNFPGPLYCILRRAGSCSKKLLSYLIVCIYFCFC